MSDDIKIAISPESWNRVVRERDEAREDLEFRRGLYKVQEEYLETARRERDEAREIIKIVAQDKDKIIEQLIVERDSNRKAFETLRGLYSNEITKNINI